MKKITEEKFRKLKFKIRKGQANDLYDALHDLEIGERLLLGKDEWKLNSDPRSIISNSQHMISGLLVGYRFSIKQLANNSGWVITRKENIEDAPEVETGYRCSVCKEMFETRRGTRRHLTETHNGEFGRVMYIKGGKRERSNRWKKYKRRKSLFKRIFNP